MPAHEPFDNFETIAKQAKRVMRKQMRGLRGTYPASFLAHRSEAIQDQLLQLPAFANAKVLALCAVPPEQRGVDTTRLATLARSLGKTVAYPRMDFDAQCVVFHVASEADLRGCGLETAEAPPHTIIVPPDTIDLVVVPVLAVDSTGVFIGDGSGTYDHVLQRLTHAVSVAVAFEFQLIPEAPRTSDDVPVAVVVTDGRVIQARGERGDGDVPGTSSTGRAAKEVRRAKQHHSMAGPVARTDGGGGGTRGRVGERA